MALDSTRIAQLKSLIDQAETNGEDPDFIQNTLIPQFKAKYDVAEVKPPEEQTPLGEAYGRASKSISQGFKDINAPMQPGLAGRFEKAGRTAAAVVNVPGQIVGGAAGLVLDPFMKPVQKAVGAYLETPVAKSIENLGGRFAKTQTGQNIYNYAQTPEAQADVRAIGNTLNAAFMGLAPGASKTTNIAGKTINRFLPSAAAQEEKAVVQAVDKGLKPALRHTVPEMEKLYPAMDKTADAVIEHMPELQILDKEGEIVKRAPRTIHETAQAVYQTKKQIYKQYSALTKEAGEAGAKVDLAPTFNKIDDLTGDGSYESLVAQGLSRDAAENAVKQAGGKLPDFRFSESERGYARKLKDELAEIQGKPPEVIEERLAKLNNQVNGYFQGMNRADRAAAQIDGSIANSLREDLDNSIANTLGENGYQDLRNQYASIKTIEKDLNHRLGVEMRKNNKGLADFSDIWTNGEIIGGLAHGNVPMIAKGVAGKATKNYIKMLNSPDYAMKRLFQKKMAARSASPLKDIPSKIGTALEKASEVKNAESQIGKVKATGEEVKAKKDLRSPRGEVVRERFSIRDKIPESATMKASLIDLDKIDDVIARLEAKGLSSKDAARIAESKNPDAIGNILGVNIPRKGTAGFYEKPTEGPKLTEKPIPSNKETLDWLSSLSEDELSKLHLPNGPDLSSAPKALRETLEKSRVAEEIRRMTGGKKTVLKLQEEAPKDLSNEIAKATEKLTLKDDLNGSFKRFWNTTGKYLGGKRALTYATFKKAFENKRKEQREKNKR